MRKYLVITILLLIPVVPWENTELQAQEVVPVFTGSELIDAPVYLGPYAPRRDDPDDLVGERIEVGETYYDYQANGTLSKQIVLDEDGGVHIVWMNGLEQDLAGPRHIYYNYIVDDEPQFDEGVEADGADRAGYTNIGYAPDVGAIPNFHANFDNAILNHTVIAMDDEFGEGDFSSFRMGRHNNREFVWPHGTVDRNGNTHVVARDYPTIDTPMDLQYVRGEVDDDGEWEFSDPVIADQIKTLFYTVAASRESDKVAIAYIGLAFDPDEENQFWDDQTHYAGMCSDIKVFESENGEEWDWEEPINVTQVARPDPDADEDSPFYQGDTLRPYLYVDACYDNDDNLHVVFTTGSMIERIDPGDNEQGYIRGDAIKCFVWHWDMESEVISLVADGWYTANGNPGAWRANISYPSIGVAEDGTLYLTYVKFPQDGDRAQNGFINGEIYATVSIDNGLTWAEGINLTNTHANNSDIGDGESECWCSLAEVVDDNLHISYIFDLDPGGIPQNEGAITLNPVMYHKVSIDDIPTEPLIMGRNFHVGFPPEISVEPEEIETVGVPDGDPGEVELTISNPNEDGIGLYIQLTTDEDLAGLVTFDPPVLRIAPGEEEIVTVIFAPEEQGIFEGIIFIDHNAPEPEEPIEIAFTGLAAEGYGDISGNVYDLSNDDAIGNALINLAPGGFRTESNEDGNYLFEHIPAWDYEITCQVENFLIFNDEVELGVDEEVEYNIAMRFGTFALSEERIEISVAVDEEFMVEFSARNEGNGAVNFQTNIIFPEENEFDPLTIRADFNAAEVTEDSRLTAVAFADNHFFIAGGDNGNNDNSNIYVINRDGELIETFGQFAETRYGIRDLTYDGELLWGVDGANIYGFTTEGELITTIEGPLNTHRAIAWDSVRDLLWVSDRRSDVVAVNVNGDVIMRFNGPEDNRVTGLGFYPYDVDGCQLYFMTVCDDSNTRLLKFNIDDEQYVPVRDLPVPNDQGASGIDISPYWDPYNWVIAGMVVGDPDAVVVWQVAPRHDWISFDPAEGSVDAESSLNINAVFNTDGLPIDVDFEADAIFEHNGRGDAVELPIVLSVTNEGGFTRRNLDIPIGWSMISLNIEPETDDIEELFQTMVENGSLLMLKDDEGRFYRPDVNFNNIPNWSYSDGYHIKMAVGDHLNVSGTSIGTRRPMELSNGWQMVSYYPRREIEATVALAGITEELIIAKNGDGLFYIPEWDYCNIGDMKEGQGYLLNMQSGIELVYNLGEERIASSCQVLTPDRTTSESPMYFAQPVSGFENMSILVNDVPKNISEIAAVNSAGVIAGVGSVDNLQRCGIAVWSKDENANTTGLANGETFLLTGWDGQQERTLEIEWIEGTPSYLTNGIAIGKVVNADIIPDEYALYAAYPNPFNAAAHIKYDLPEAVRVKLDLFDASGRFVETFVNSEKPAGRHSVVIRADDLASGIYFYQIQAGSFRQLKKVVLMR